MNRLSRLLPSLALSLLTLGTLPTMAHAEALQVRTQVPGYQRHMVGQFEVTALYDGRIQLAHLIAGAGPMPDELRTALQPSLDDLDAPPLQP